MRLGPIVVACLLFVTTFEESDPQTVGEVESLIRENQPVGSHRVRVIQVLSDRGIETSGLQRELEPSTRSSGALRGSTTYSSIAIESYFDEGGRLLRHELRETPARP